MSQHACICPHMCVRRLHGAFSEGSLLKTQRTMRCWWLAYVARVPCLHHDTRIHTLLLPSSAIDSCTFNKSAEIQLLACSSLRNFISWAHTGNCLSRCQGGNWIAGLGGGKTHTHCSSAHLVILWIVGRLHNGELKAYVSSTGYSFYKEKFLIEVFCFSSATPRGRACSHWGNEQDISWQVFTVKSSEKSECRRV